MSPVTVAMELAKSWVTPPTARELHRTIRCPIVRAAAVTRLSRHRCNLPSDLAGLRRRDLRRARAMRNPATGGRYLLKDLARLINLSEGRISRLIGEGRPA